MNQAISIERVTISLPRLPTAFDGLKVGLLADVHASPPRRGVAHVEGIVRAVNSLAADVVLLVGDMVHKPAEAPMYLPSLAQLQARLGVWASLGNHEHAFVWYCRYLGSSPPFSVDDWRRMYADVGITLLANEARPLANGASRIWLVGVDDAYSGHDDLPGALQHAYASDFCLVMTHSPDVVDQPLIGQADLVLAGHAHGGQVRLPWLGAIWAPCRKPRQRAAGLVRTNGTTLYVTRGAGEWLPLRFRCPREITLLELRSSARPDAE